MCVLLLLWWWWLWLMLAMREDHGWIGGNAARVTTGKTFISILVAVEQLRRMLLTDSGECRSIDLRGQRLLLMLLLVLQLVGTNCMSSEAAHTERVCRSGNGWGRWMVGGRC